VSLRGYSVSEYYLSPNNSLKLQALFESASMFFAPTQVTLGKLKEE
jgi:hypothetical protein